MMENVDIVRVAEICKVLSHPARIKIAELLLESEKTVGELRVLLDLPQSTVSQHLSTLRSKHLIELRDCHGDRCYVINDLQFGALVDAALRVVSSDHSVHQEIPAELDAQVNRPAA